MSALAKTKAQLTEVKRDKAAAVRRAREKARRSREVGEAATVVGGAAHGALSPMVPSIGPLDQQTTSALAGVAVWLLGMQLKQPAVRALGVGWAAAATSDVTSSMTGHGAGMVGQ